MINELDKHSKYLNYDNNDDDWSANDVQKCLQLELLQQGERSNAVAAFQSISYLWLWYN